MAAAALSIQESLFPDLTCFGCGPANTEGFHLRSYQHGDLTVAMFTPRPEHDNGFGFLDGGIMATVLDCHSAAGSCGRSITEDGKLKEGHPSPSSPQGSTCDPTTDTPRARVGTASETGGHLRIRDHCRCRNRVRRQAKGHGSCYVEAIPSSLAPAMHRVLRCR